MDRVRVMERFGRFAPDVGGLAVGALAGMAWSFGELGLAFVPAAVIAWMRAKRRGAAWGVMALYYAVALRPILVALPRFSAGGAPAALLTWCAVAAGVAGVWAAFWSPRMRKDSVEAVARTAAAMVITAVPPIGIVGIAHPAFAAGIWFPGFGWIGLAAFVLLLGLTRRDEGIYACIAVSLVGALIPSSSPAPDHWSGIDTEVVHVAAVNDYGAQFEVANASRIALDDSEAHIRILPESSGGVWTREMRQLWQPSLRELGRAEEVVVGALVPVGSSESFRSVALVLGRGGERARYRQRVPVPLAMWRPWAEQTVEANWTGRGVMNLGNRLAGFLICYEQGLLWTTLQSIMQGADVLVTLSNAYWFRGTDAAVVGRVSANAVGRLFGLPVVSAINE